jgi:uncharacterized membrane protein YhaH (DUF805 family)
MEWALMPFRKYATFSGRARRKEYWLFALLVLVVSLVLSVIEAAAGLADEETAYGPLSGLWSLVVFIPSLAVAVRRLHDLDRTGWWIIAPLAAGLVYVAGIVLIFTDNAVTGGALAGVGFVVMMIAVILLLVFMVLPGTNGPNRFGPDPLREDHRETFA